MLIPGVRLCLICDDVAVIGIPSEQGQVALLCGIHWADYCSSEASLTGDEVRKFFDDGARGDKARRLDEVVDLWEREHKTDETRGEYRTDEQEEG